MLYRKINLELLVIADEADGVVEQLNAAVDKLEETYTIFGGEIETAPVEHRGTRKKTALMHTVAAGETAVGAVRLARDKVAGAFRSIL